MFLSRSSSTFWTWTGIQTLISFPCLNAPRRLTFASEQRRLLSRLLQSSMSCMSFLAGSELPFLHPLLKSSVVCSLFGGSLNNSLLRYSSPIESQEWLSPSFLPDTVPSILCYDGPCMVLGRNYPLHLLRFQPCWMEFRYTCLDPLYRVLRLISGRCLQWGLPYLRHSPLLFNAWLASSHVQADWLCSCCSLYLLVARYELILG